jgi:hypothetical protein
MERIMGTVLLLVAVGCCTASGGSLAKLPQEKRSTPSAVHVEMHNVVYHCTDQIAVHILHLQGLVLPTQRKGIPVFDDVHSFTLAIRFAEIAISTEVLSHILNHAVFAAPDAPLKDITVTTVGSSLRVHGKLHGKGDIPFATEGSATATPEGSIRLQPRTVNVVQVSVKGLMDLLGLKIAQLINADKVRGVRLEGNDLLLDPAPLIPPPHIEGRVTEVRIAGEHLLLVFGTKPPAGVPPLHSGNYMALHGGQLRFGKLTMVDADVVLIDMDPQDPFDVSLAHYKDQVVAGYTQMTPAFGLRVFMRDFNKVQPPSPQHNTLLRQQVTSPR